MTNTIPQQLINLDQWVTWRFEHRNDKATKVPYIAGSDRRASATDKHTWATFDAASADNTKSGIGFVFTADDPFVGIDLDDCLLPDGELKPWAAEILAMLPPTYAEVSPSGNGIKLFISGELPADGRNRRPIGDGQVEIYARGRYFTVTGDRFKDAPKRVERADLSELHRFLFPPKPQSPDVPSDEQGGGFDGSDAELIAAALKAKNGEEFRRLWDAEDIDNHSEADLALCNMLAFWSGPDAERIDRLFRQSGLYREKWDRSDYRGWTIDKAIAERTDYFQPANSVRVNDASNVVSRAEAGKPYAMTDLGNAERLAENFKGRIRFTERGGGWYIYDGKVWKRDETGKATLYAIKTVRKIWSEAQALSAEQVTDEDGNRVGPSPREVMQKHAAKSEGQARIAAMVKLAATLPGVAIDASDFDRDPWLFNCFNGTVDLRTGELKPHDPADNITKVSPAGYHPDAVPRLWIKFLDRIFHGNVELIEYVQEMLGMCLSGDISEQIMPVFYGDGSNGKSTLLDTVMDVMGSYAGKAAPDLLMARHGEAHPTEIADLWGLRLAVASETEAGKQLRVAMVKEMTGDAELKARYMRGDFFNFRRSHKLVLMTNHKPRITESKNAIWRRLKLVPFDAVITDEERDKSLTLKLAAEFTGILAWLVRGCRRWIEADGLDDPSEVREATESYREDEDPLVDFISTRLTLDPEAFATYAQIRVAYRQWCESEGMKSGLGDRALIARLLEIEGTKKDRRRAGGAPTRGIAGVGVSDAQ